jgi:hypothetical protein
MQRLTGNPRWGYSQGPRVTRLQPLTRNCFGIPELSHLTDGCSADPPRFVDSQRARGTGKISRAPGYSEHKNLEEF